MMTFIESYWDALVMMMAEMAPYLMLGSFIAGLLRTFVPHSLYSRHLAPRNMKSVVKAAALGIPLPLCSCGVIPTSVGLRKEGASHGACTRFLIATPPILSWDFHLLLFDLSQHFSPQCLADGWSINMHVRMSRFLLKQL